MPEKYKWQLSSKIHCTGKCKNSNMYTNDSNEWYQKKINDNNTIQEKKASCFTLNLNTFVGKMKDTNSDMMFLLIYFHPHKINFLDKKHSLKTYLFCIFFTNPFLQTNNLLDGSFSLPLLPTIQKLNCLSFCF